MELKLGNLLIVCCCAGTGYVAGSAIAGTLLGLVLMPIAGVLGYKYAREQPGSQE